MEDNEKLAGPGWHIRGPRALWIAVAILLLLYASLTVLSMRQVGPTVDEPTLMRAARLMIQDGNWDMPLKRLHGPLPLYANQLFWSEHPGALYDEHTRFLARLGMLPFGLLAGLLTFLLARRAYGDLPGLLALLLFAINPLMIGYGALVAVDMAYTAGVLLAICALWHFLARPGWLRLLAVGAALGVAFATKFLALLIAPPIAITAALGLHAHARRNGQRALLVALTSLVLLTLVSILVLNACYGFIPPLASGDPQAYGSEFFRTVIGIPLLGDVLRLLPEPYLLGLDYQFAVSQQEHSVYLRGSYAHGHSDYYLWCLLVKTPEIVLLLALLGLARALWPLQRPEQTRLGRRTMAALLPAMAVLLVYLSFFNRIQIGIRYILPLYPLLFILGGGGFGWIRTASSHLNALTLGIIALVCGLDAFAQWPNLIAYYNFSAGGQGEAYRHFKDSNSDWGQLRVAGREKLERGEGERPGFLDAAAGPRLGRVAIYIDHWIQPDPEQPARARHWLDPFPPVGHVGAAWWVFDVEAEAWAAAAARSADERVRAELIVALVAAGRYEAAREHLGLLSPGRAAALRELLERQAAFSVETATRAEADALALAWLAVRRFDQAAAVKAAERLRDPAGDRLLVQIWTSQGQLDEALAEQERIGVSAPTDLMILFQLYLQANRLHEAIELMAPRLDEIPDALRDGMLLSLEQARDRLEMSSRIRDLR